VAWPCIPRMCRLTNSGVRNRPLQWGHSNPEKRGRRYGIGLWSCKWQGQHRTTRFSLRQSALFPET
jgi:hypothetical protein